MWRNTGISPKFFIFDARSFLFLLVFLVRMSSYTLAISIMGILVFWCLDYVGMKPNVALRTLRTKFFGGVRPSRDTKIFRQRCS